MIGRIYLKCIKTGWCPILIVFSLFQISSGRCKFKIKKRKLSTWDQNKGIKQTKNVKLLIVEEKRHSLPIALYNSSLYSGTMEIPRDA